MCKAHPWLVVVVALSGCGALLHLDDPMSSGTPGADAGGSGSDPGGSDADGNEASSELCFGAGIVKICPGNPVTPQDTIVIQTAATLNTDTSNLCEPYHLPGNVADSSLCVLAANTVTIEQAGRWTIIGTRPLVLIGDNSISIDGQIDIASHRGGTAGAGSNATACIAGTAPHNKQGGPGGTFGSGGGDGGGVLGAAKAPASAPPMSVTTLRGGCAGLAGDGGNGGAGGRGGGALALVSANLTISGNAVINTSGAAGENGGLSSGGGGGGSGGMIVLDAPIMLVSGRIAANGGGGGEGGGGQVAGRDGSDPDPQVPLQQANGGNGGAPGGGDGGDGAAGSSEGADGQNAPDNNGGGGGGGGAHGVIRVVPSQNLGGTISPQPT